MTDPIVVDLSHHNPTPDWAMLKAGGIVGVIHKATEGTGYTDPTLFKRMSAAKAAGLLTATYHFMRPGKLAQQIDFYLKTIDPVPGERVVLDHEDAGVSVNDLAYAVAHLIEQRPDLQVTIYSGHLIKEQLGQGYNGMLAGQTSLWIAQYTTAAAPSWPKGTWPAWSLWQYTDHATVPGISAGVDGNRWNGSEDALIKWLSPAGTPAPAPTPEPTPEPTPDPGHYVKIDIEVGPGVEVFVNVNEDHWGPLE